MNRRDFLRRAAMLGGATVLAACGRAKPGDQPASAEAAASEPATATPTPSARPTSTVTPRPAATATPRALPSATRAQPPTSQPEQQAAAVAPPTTAATPTLPAASGAWIGTVVLVKSADRAEGVRRALQLLAVNPVKGANVLLKPNFNSADPAPGSTHPDVLRALVTELQGMGARKITVGDRSGMGVTPRVMQQVGAVRLAKELGFDTVVFDDLAEKEWVLIKSKDNHWARGFAVPKLLLDADAVVQTCNLKTHRFGGHFTLSLKNSVGFAAKQVAETGYNYMSELHASPNQRTMIAEINRTYAPGLIVMDGVEAFTTGGPDRGNLVRPEVVLASRDRIALDAVGVAILRLFGTTPQVSAGRVFEQAQIARAVALELGAKGPGDVRILTADAASEAFAAKIRPLIT
ncbi:MAG: DUF362 domain-containing protein [Nitrososphaerales archaeon]